jgi:hypothetical protein
MKCAFLRLNPNLPKFKAQTIIEINSIHNESKTSCISSLFQLLTSISRVSKLLFVAMTQSKYWNSKQKKN